MGLSSEVTVVVIGCLFTVEQFREEGAHFVINIQVGFNLYVLFQALMLPMCGIILKE